jgi:hypothetical protein
LEKPDAGGHIAGCRQTQALLIKKLYSAEIFVLTSAAGLTVTRYGQPLGADSFVARRKFRGAYQAAQRSYPAQFVYFGRAPAY